MIITSAKPFEVILALLKNEDNMFVIGCNVCAAKLRIGGEPEVLKMCRKLEESGKHVVGWALPTAACSIRSFESLVEKNEKITSACCILVMGCGSGVSSISNVVDVPVYSSTDTISLGGSSGGELIHNQCIMCGNCIIGEFGGICPKARCAKGLLNGPCGGNLDGKCEIDKLKDCAWTLIYERLKKIERLDLLYIVHTPQEHGFK